jgi:hypothetical protein
VLLASGFLASQSSITGILVAGSTIELAQFSHTQWLLVARQKQKKQIVPWTVTLVTEFDIIRACDAKLSNLKLMHRIDERDAMLDRDTEIRKALEFDFNAYGWGAPRVDDLDRLAIDSDFVADERNLLIDYMNNDIDDYDLEAFLRDCESDRYLDLRRAFDTIKMMRSPHPTLDYYPHRDELSKLAMDHSLCPIHWVDWAICFDDEPEDCAQIRAIFPNGHDT